MRAPLEDHIAERLVTPRPDCKIWVGATDNGYGRIGIDGKTARVHRVVWEMTNGPIPEGLTIDHLCRVRACCNTEHMELVTQSVNAKRAVHPASKSLTCKRGHEYGTTETGRHCEQCRRDYNDARREARRAAARARAA